MVTAHGTLTLTPISTIDTNCIEDYLKMIESMQSDQQGASSTSGHGAGKGSQVRGRCSHRKSREKSGLNPGFSLAERNA